MENLCFCGGENCYYSIRCRAKHCWNNAHFLVELFGLLCLDFLGTTIATENTNLGPREQFERATREGLAVWCLWSLLGVAHIVSPAALRGESTGSRATGRAPSQVALAGRKFLSRLGVGRDSQNVLSSSNPTSSLRAALGSSTNTGFQLSLLVVNEKTAESAWEKTSTAIGNGLGRPGLYMSGRQSCVPLVNIRTYFAKGMELIRMTSLITRISWDGPTTMSSLQRKMSFVDGLLW